MSECIEWQHGKIRGYGQVRLWGKSHRAHRVAYRMYHDLGEDEMPEVVMHTCDNPACYNVEHLKGGTQADNVRDMANKGRHVAHNAAKTHCMRGHSLSGDNLRIYKGERVCIECKRQRNLKRDRSGR